MARFFTSDLHLGHANIIGYTGRPYDSVEQMNADLVERWNSLVGEHDEVWVLGEVAMGRLDDSLAYVQLLNGTKFLIPGNHDRMFKCQGTKYTNACRRYLDAGFTEILDDAQYARVGSDKVRLSHFPYEGDSRHGYEDRYQEYRPPNEGLFLLHGQTHGLWRRNGRMVDVGVDAWGGYPVHEADLVWILSQAEESIGPIPWT